MNKIHKYIPNLISTGCYRARLDNIIRINDEQFGNSLKWEFTVRSQDLPGYVIAIGFTEARLEPNTILHAWLEVLGVKFEDIHDSFDVDSLIGRQVTVHVEKTLDGERIYAKVIRILASGDNTHELSGLEPRDYFDEPIDEFEEE